MENLKSTGECLFCKKQYSKAGINRHLKTHLAEVAIQNKPGASFLLKVEPDPGYWMKNPFFLSLWVDGDTLMHDLDNFLRGIWLECCDHLSAFTDPVKRRQREGMWSFFEAQEMLEQGRVKEYEDMMEQAKGEIPMSRKAKDVFYEGRKVEYEYDFGSTTHLQLTVMGAYPSKADKNIVLLSRNEPPAIKCHSCGKETATEMCSVCGYDDDDYMFCTKCAKKHAKKCEDFADYSGMPIVNSPRTGVCGYQGGTIDTKRDGVLKII
ncbi:hypothetical protein [Sinomicrobium sp. M5D2P9]